MVTLVSLPFVYFPALFISSFLKLTAMKPSLLTMPFGVVLLFLYTSCGGNDQNTNTGTASSDTATTTSAQTTTTTPASIVTTPQPMMIAQHRVKNFNSWKASYDAHDSMRQANGIHSYVISRDMTDSNMIQVATKVDDMAKAKAFAKAPSLKQAMQRGGVTGTPKFYFMTMTWQDTSTINSAIRSMVMMNVKEWNAWKTSFENGKQERMQNGLVDRAYGHDADDSTKVFVVVAVMDTAKARAYWNSDQLKQRRTQGGVIGNPERRIYRVVQRY